MLLAEPLIFECGAPGRVGWRVPDVEAPDPELLPEASRREDDLEGFPELSELEVVRHFVRLSQWNYSAATTFYPLGSCTMKYNPAVNEALARLEGFSNLHPLAPVSGAQGALELLAALSRALLEVSGLDAVTLQPSAGAQGELLGLMLVRAFHAERRERRRKIIVPATAHGTNPASSALCGYEVVEAPVGDRGVLEPAAVEAVVDGETAALMITNPNTLGLFETEMAAVAEIVHRAGALVFMDGANLNALLGVAKPADMGVDVMQFNLHKTFGTPHGGGGPGAGPVAVRASLAPYLPVPRLVQRENGLAWEDESERTVGRLRAFTGNFGVLVRAYAYVASLGGAGLEAVGPMAILSANYLLRRLARAYHLPYDSPCMHECVLSDRNLQDTGVKTLDVAKRLLDYGFHAPTIYFPLVVSGALMIEPTETESKQVLDSFVEAMLAIEAEARERPEHVRSAPHATALERLDETRAARRPILRWHPAAEPPGGRAV